jgi:hypothetical protein
MITVVCLALLIFSLIERQIRAALRAQGRTTVAGLYAGRPAIPTTRLIFQALTSLRLIPATSGNPHTIPQPTPCNSKSSTYSTSIRWNGADDRRPAEYGARRRRALRWCGN